MKSDPSKFKVDQAVGKKHASRAHRKITENSKRLIEGEYVTAPEIAERLGLKLSIVYERISKLKKRPGPITWEALRTA